MISGSHPGRRSGVDRYLARTDAPLVARSSAAGRSVDANFATRNAARVVPTTGTGSVRAAAVAEVRPSGDLQGAPERRLSDLRSSPRGYQAPEPGGAWLPLSDTGSEIAGARPCQRDCIWVLGEAGSRRRVGAHNGLIPRLSTFYGIVIYMYRPDHPPPHFHAQYGEDVAQIALGTLEILAGSLPPRALRLVREWAQLHPDELGADWELAQALEPLVPIDPLP
jgi:hypothetical protein